MKRILILGDSAAIHSVPANSPLILKTKSRVGVRPISSLFKKRDAVEIQTEGTLAQVAPVEGVEVYSGEQRQPWNRVLHISRHRYSGPIHRVVTGFGICDVTPNHSLLTHIMDKITSTEAVDKGARLYAHRMRLETKGASSHVPPHDIYSYIRGQASHIRTSGSVKDANYVLNQTPEHCMRFIGAYRSRFKPEPHFFVEQDPLLLQSLMAMLSTYTEAEYSFDVGTNGELILNLGSCWNPDLADDFQRVRQVYSYDYSGWVYDIETDNNHSFVAGVGNVRVHNSGFGKCIREIFKRVVKEKDMQVLQVGWFHKDLEEAPWEIIPTEMRDEQPTVRDKHGEITLPRVLAQYRPDIVWTNGDPWMVPHVAPLRKAQGFTWLAQTYIEAGPVFNQHKEVWNRTDLVVPVTHYGREVISRVEGIDHSKLGEPIGNGVDGELYKPYSNDKIREVRSLVLSNPAVYENKGQPFIIGYNGRNHTRKMVANLYVLAGMLKDRVYRHCMNCRITVAPDRHWEAREWIIQKRCPKCGKKLSKPSKHEPEFVFWFHIPHNDRGYRLKELEWQFNLTDKIGMTDGYTVLKGLPEHQLPSFYNSLDLFLSFADEGFGLPYVEAMSCGVPVVSPAHSAGHEVTRDLNLNWEAAGWWIQESLHIPRPMPDYTSVLTKIFSVVRDKVGRYRNKALEIAAYRNWDDVADKWLDLFRTFTPEKRADDGVYVV